MIYEIGICICRQTKDGSLKYWGDNDYFSSIESAIKYLKYLKEEEEEDYEEDEEEEEE